MEQKQLKCPKCGGEMETGFVFDRGDWSIPMEPIWGTDYKPLSLRINGGIGNKKIVKSFRCNSCGFLESYAN